MTEGRLETIHNLRPKNWDNRRHWTNWHHLYDCEPDHIARESAPFHDLRAGGQFQYEYWGSGPYAEPIEPGKLAARKAGDRMDFTGGKSRDMGDVTLIRPDIEPGRPHPPSNAIKRSGGPLTKKNPLNRGLFSTYEWMPEGPPSPDKTPAMKAQPRGLDLPAPDKADERKGLPRSGFMKAGGPARYLGQPAEYIPDPYRERPQGGRVGHFKTGPIERRAPEWMPEGPEDVRPTRKYGPFYAGKPNGFTLGGDVEWVPDPYDMGEIKKTKRPFYTWHTRTKWSMPTHAPWSTGLTTAEDRKAATFNQTDAALPSLNTFTRVNLNQTLGSEAAIGTLDPPSRVRFKKHQPH